MVSIHIIEILIPSFEDGAEVIENYDNRRG
jgi:hypothetical protein